MKAALMQMNPPRVLCNINTDDLSMVSRTVNEMGYVFLDATWSDVGGVLYRDCTNREGHQCYIAVLKTKQGA